MRCRSKARRPPHTPITKAGMVFGTPEYMAPEQALGQNVDGRADLYALGVILYEMLSGSRPFSSQSQVGILGQQLSKLPPKISDRAPGIIVPPTVEAVAMKLLQREASDRYQSASEVVDVINRLWHRSRGAASIASRCRKASPSSPPPSSPEAQALRDAITVSSRPKQPAPVAMPVSMPGSIPDAEAPLGDGATAPLDVKLEALRAKLPAGMQGAVKNVPTRVLFGALGAFRFGDRDWLARRHYLGFFRPQHAQGRGLGEPRAASSSRPAPFASPPWKGRSRAPTNSPKPKQLAAPALDALLEKYPRDPNIAVEQAHVLAAQKNYAGAVGAVGHATVHRPGVPKQRASRVVGVPNRASEGQQRRRFALLEGAMGSRGADIAYDLVTTSNVRPWVQSRAETSCNRPRSKRSHRNSRPARHRQAPLLRRLRRKKVAARRPQEKLRRTRPLRARAPPRQIRLRRPQKRRLLPLPPHHQRPRRRHRRRPHPPTLK